MFSTLHRGTRDQRGFTLVEILVVILIVGILAAIAIPAFLNQRNKAHDAAVKTQLTKAATAEEIYSTDNHGAYKTETIGPTDNGPLATIEPTMKETPNVTATANATTGYTLVSTASGTGGDVFTYTDTNGTVSRTCSGNGGGCTHGSW